jgi:hypothetical protein
MEHWRSEGKWEESGARNALVPRIRVIEGYRRQRGVSGDLICSVSMYFISGSRCGIRRLDCAKQAGTKKRAKQQTQNMNVQVTGNHIFSILQTRHSSSLSEIHDKSTPSGRTRAKAGMTATNERDSKSEFT